MRHWYILCALFISLFSFFSFGEENLGEKDEWLALLEAENAAMKKENSMLRKELTEVLLKNKALEDKILKFELGISSALANPGASSVSEREFQVLKDMLILRDAVKDFSNKTKNLATLVQRIIGSDAEDKNVAIDKIKAKIALDELKDSSEKLLTLMESAVEKPNLERCSVLDVDDKKKVLILSAGTVDGAFCGLFVMAEGDPDIVARIISVRPFSSAAMLMKGKIEKVVPGMIFVPGKGKLSL